MTALLIVKPSEIFSAWEEGKVPLMVDPENNIKDYLKPHVLIDAILAKRNVRTKITDAPLVVGLGPGFKGGKDVHVVIETNRGHNLGRLIFEGEAEPNTGCLGLSLDLELRGSLGLPGKVSLGFPKILAIWLKREKQ